MLTNYFKSITNVASQGDAREESFYSCLETLLQKTWTTIQRTIALQEEIDALYPEAETLIVEI